ncbi:MAG: head decoration protein [Sporomusa sp.]
MAELVQTIGTFTYDNLIGGDNPPIRTKIVTIVSGAGLLVRGTVLGKITASGKYQTVNSTATDGSQMANCVLARDIDASTADTPAEVYISGVFNIEALTFGGTDTAALHEEAMRDLNMYMTSEQ